MARHDTLTTREFQIVWLISEGQTDRQIATQLGIGRRTVSNHVSIILLKLDALSRAHAVTKAMRQGILAIPVKESLGKNPS